MGAIDMLNLPSDIRIFVATSPCDMRKQHSGLRGLVQQITGEEPGLGCLYVFWNARRDLMKVLFRDKHGACLLAKRLDKGAFKIVTKSASSMDTVEITHKEMVTLLQNLHFDATSR